MKVYVAVRANGDVTGVYKTYEEALNAFPARWYINNGATITELELEGISSSWPPDCLKDGVAVWDFNLEPEQLRPKRGATVNVTINYEGLNLEAMVKEAVDKALALREWVTIMQGVS